MLRLLTVTNLYPSATRPRHGVFVEQRLRQMVATGRVSASVVAPVPWVPPGLRTGARAAEWSTPAREERHGIVVHHPRFTPVPTLSVWLNPVLFASGCWPVVRSLAAAEAYTAVDGHFVYPDGIAAVLLARRLGLPAVVTARGSDVNTMRPGSMQHRWLRWSVSRGANFVAVARALADRLVDLGVPQSRVVVVRNGVDLDRFRPGDRAAQRAALGFTRPTLLLVGNLVPEKGQRLVLDALVHLPECALVVVGSGPDERRLRDAAEANGVATRVTWVPYLDQHSLAQWYGAADAVVLASEREGMPNVLLESLACGTPVVATAVGGVPEVVSAPVAGALVRERTAAAMAAAIRGLLDAPPDRDAVRRHAETFGWGRSVAMLLELFERARIGAAARADAVH